MHDAMEKAPAPPAYSDEEESEDEGDETDAYSDDEESEDEDEGDE